MTRALAAAATATAAVGVSVVLSAVPAAHAASSPPWEPDAHGTGTITFYDSSGTVITSGSTTTAPIAAYAAASTTIRSGDTRAVLDAAQPNPKGSTGTWNVDQLSAVTTYPVTTGPASVQALGAGHPVVTGASGDLSLASFIAEFPNTGPSGGGCAYETTAGNPATCTNASYQNIYQLRIQTLDTNGVKSTSYATADVLVSGTTWTEVYPTGGTGPTGPGTPSISGTSRVGSTVTCNESTGGASFAWHVGGAKVGSGKTLKIPGSAGGKILTCIATVSGQSATSTGKRVALGAALHATKKPTVSGSVKVGKEKVKHGTWSPAASGYSYQWYLGSKKIKGATRSSYKLVAKDKGMKVSVQVTAKKTGYASGHAKTKAVTVK